MGKNVLSLCDLLLEDNLNPTRLNPTRTNKSYVYLYQTFWQICFTIEMQIFCFFSDLSGYLCVMMVYVYYRHQKFPMTVDLITAEISR